MKKLSNKKIDQINKRLKKAYVEQSETNYKFFSRSTDKFLFMSPIYDDDEEEHVKFTISWMQSSIDDYFGNN